MSRAELEPVSTQLKLGVTDDSVYRTQLIETGPWTKAGIELELVPMILEPAESLFHLGLVDLVET